MSKTLNTRYVIKLFLVLAVGGAAVHFLHRKQAHKQADVFLHLAESAGQEKQYAREISYLRRYLALRPGDVDARERLGAAIEKRARSGQELMQAFLVNEQVLRDAPDRAEVRRRNANLALRLGLYPEAKGHVEELLKANGQDFELINLLGQCQAAAGEFEKAAQTFQEAIDQSGGKHLDSFARRAAVLRRDLNRPREADAVVAEMVRKNERSADAYLIAAGYRKGYGTPEQVADAVANAWRLAPDNPDVLLAAADVARGEGELRAGRNDREGADRHFDEARRLLRRGVELRPTAAVLYQNLASLEARTRRLPEAVELVKQGLEAVRKEAEANPDKVELARAKLDLLWALADLHVRQNHPDEAEAVLGQLREGGYPPVLVDYQTARVEALREHWKPAAETLERVRPDLPEGSDVARQANLLLGQCYEQLGARDRQLDAYRKAVPASPRDPLWATASLRVADTLAALGRTDEAVEAYQKVAALRAGAWLPAARLMLVRNLRLPAAKRDWGAVKAAIQRVEDALPKGDDVNPVRAEIALLRGEMLAGQEQFVEARVEIVKARELDPKGAAPWVALALLERRAGDNQRAEAVLGEAEGKLGDRVEFRLARARLLPVPATPESLKRLVALAGGDEKFSPAERLRLRRGIADVALAFGATDVASGLWERLAESRKDDLGLHELRFDYALRKDDEEGMKRVLEDIRAAEGAGTTWRMGKAMYLIWKARRGDLGGLDEANELLGTLERDRGDWSRVHLGQALVADLRGQPEAAVDKYRQALRLGERNPDMARRLMELLNRQRRYAEAAAVLRDLPEGGGRDDLRLLAAEANFGARDYGSALDLAEKSVREDSKNYRHHLFLGQARWAAGKKEEAEAPFLKAKELAPEEPAVWVALVQYYVASDKKEKAVATVEDARGHLKKDAGIALAQCYALVGDLERAKGEYQQALKERPDDVPLLLSAANFLMQAGEAAEARALLNKVADHPKSSAVEKVAANRVLVLLTAADPDYQTARQALARLGLPEEGQLPPPDPGATAEELRTRAMVLALRPERSKREEAIRLLQELDNRQSLAPTDLFLLAQLHAANGEWPKARLRLVRLLKDHDDNALYVSYYVRACIHHRELAEARARLDKLEARYKDAFRTVELRARLLAADGQGPAAKARLLKFAEAKDVRVAVAVAGLLEELKLGEAAEPLYKKAVAESKRPEAVLVLAAYYARQNRLNEALAVCEGAWKTCPPEAVAAACVAVLYTGPSPDADQLKKVERWIDEAARKSMKPVPLLLQLAAVKNRQGDYAASAELYRQVLRADPRNSLAMNNLAYLLSLKEGKHDEALRLVREAEQVSGPRPVLRDTEAMVHLAAGRPEDAIRVLADTVGEGTGASSYFHLARAYLLANKPLDARINWDKARQRNLKPADLHPLEHGDYEKMVAKLGKG